MFDADIEGNTPLLGAAAAAAMDGDSSSPASSFRLRRRADAAKPHPTVGAAAAAVSAAATSGVRKLLRRKSKGDLESAADGDGGDDDDDNGKKPLYRAGPEYDEDLPYGGLVYLARKKRPDGWICIGVQVVIVIATVGFAIAGYYHAELFHFHVTKFYAQLGHPHAQHVTAQKYLHGKGVDRNHTAAMYWFRQAADQGHPHAAYNLAVGRMKGMHKDTKPGEVHELIKHAAANGVEEAHDVLHHVCSKGNCDM